MVSQRIFLLKEFLTCNGCFRLFTKMKKGSGTSFWCTFSALFFCKNVPYLFDTLSIDKVLMSYLFFLLMILNEMFIRVLFRQLLGDIINFKIYLWSSSKAMAGFEEAETQKFEYLENKKSFLDEIKSIFHNYICAIIWWKIKKK